MDSLATLSHIYKNNKLTVFTSIGSRGNILFSTIETMKKYALKSSQWVILQFNILKRSSLFSNTRFRHLISEIKWFWMICKNHSSSRWFYFIQLPFPLSWVRIILLGYVLSQTKEARKKCIFPMSGVSDLIAGIKSFSCVLGYHVLNLSVVPKSLIVPSSGSNSVRINP